MDDSQNSFGLALYDGDGLARARQWAKMQPSQRRREAMRAANERDFDALWSLVMAHQTLHSSSGVHTSPHTIKAYQSALRILLRGWAGENLLHPGSEAAALWIRSMEKDGRSASTVQQRLAAARKLYGALRWAGAIDSDPFIDVKPARDNTPAWSKRSPYRDSEIEALLAAAASPEDKTLVYLCGHVGLRVAEACSLTREGVDFERHTITVIGKGRKTRTVPASRRCLDHLATIETKDGHYFPYRSTDQARHRLEKLCQTAGVTYKAAHALRHSVGTRMYRETGKLELAQRQLGHSSTQTTLIYAHFGNEELDRVVSDW